MWSVMAGQQRGRGSRGLNGTRILHDRIGAVGYKYLYFCPILPIEQIGAFRNRKGDYLMRVTRNFMSAMLGIGSKTSSSRSRRMSYFQPSGAERILNAGKTDQTGSSQAVYQNMKKYAGELQYTASELTKTGEDSLFAKAKESGDTTGITKQVKEFVDKYNGMVRSLKSSGSRVDNSYLNQLNSNAMMCRSALEATGVTRNSDGTLSVNDKALKGASLEQLEKAWGGEGVFVKKTSAAAENVQANAVSGMNNLINNSYSSLLKNFGTRGNFFNFFS